MTVILCVFLCKGQDGRVTLYYVIDGNSEIDIARITLAFGVTFDPFVCIKSNFYKDSTKNTGK